MKGYTPERFTDGKEAPEGMPDEWREEDIKEIEGQPLDLSGLFDDETAPDEIPLPEGIERSHEAPIIKAVPTDITPTKEDIIKQIKKLNTKDPITEKEEELNDLFDMIKYTSPSKNDDEIIFYLEQLNIFPKLSGYEILNMIRRGNPLNKILKRYKTKITRPIIDPKPTDINPIFRQKHKIIYSPYYRAPYLYN